MNPVPVSGMGVVCAAGTGLPGVMESLFLGLRNFRLPTRLTLDHASLSPVFEVTSALPDAPSRTVALALASAREALADAGLVPEDLREKRVGVCLGTSVGASLYFLQAYADHKDGRPVETTPLARFLKANPAQSLARLLDLDGPVQTVTNACSSGTDAIGVAKDWIRSGLCDVALAGGTDELDDVTYAGFRRLMITDDGPCRPFDLKRKGLNLGEGAGVLVMESQAGLKRRKGRARGGILGYATSSDSHHPTAPHPEGPGLVRAIELALALSQWSPEELDFVNAHATGTRINDRVEARVLGRLLPSVPVSATKGYTGHALGAAGAVEAVLSLAFLERGQVPASAGFEALDPELGLTPIAEPTQIRGRGALSLSLAFGGVNSALTMVSPESL